MIVFYLLQCVSVIRSNLIIFFLTTGIVLTCTAAGKLGPSRFNTLLPNGRGLQEPPPVFFHE